MPADPRMRGRKLGHSKGRRRAAFGPPPGASPPPQARKPTMTSGPRPTAARPPVSNDSGLKAPTSRPTPGGTSIPRPPVSNDSGLRAPKVRPVGSPGTASVPRAEGKVQTTGRAVAPGHLKKAAGAKSAKAYTPSRRRL